MTHASTFEAAVRGATCTKLLVQEAWHQDELLEPANIVFLQVDGARWVQFYIDAGFFSWREIEEPVAIPDEETAPEFRYPLVDASAAFPELGARVAEVRLTEHPLSSADLELRLSDGRVLRLHNAEDVSRLELIPAAG